MKKIVIIFYVTVQIAFASQSEEAEKPFKGNNSKALNEVAVPMTVKEINEIIINVEKK